ncbi:MAG: PEGA domain-containing protein [Patescibacteria group bacterium]|nr:PEGA domain-containing protein [Patescibacteria group bacterium]
MKNSLISIVLRAVLLLVIFLAVFCKKEVNEPEVPKFGTLVVISTPTGAAITLDKNSTDKITPATFTNLIVGIHEVALFSAGYNKWVGNVQIIGDKTQNLNVNLSVKCPGDNIIGNLNLPPEINIIGLKAGDTQVKGKANNVDTKKYRVVLWAKTDFYYVQPLVSNPFTSICGDGSWYNSTRSWDRVVALLVDQNYTAGDKRIEHPSLAPNVLAWDEYPAKCSPTGIVGNINEPPAIKIIGLKSGDKRVSGSADNTDVSKTKVVLYAKTDYWYIQPIIANPYTGICGNSGLWSNTTYPWNRIIALLVDQTYIPQSKVSDHPSLASGVLAWDEYPSPCTPVGIVGSLDSLPEIKITSAASGWIKGEAKNIDVGKIRVVLWAKTNIWYVQPWVALPYTQICGNNGFWENSTHSWNTMVALLVDSSYVPGATRNYHPSGDRGVVAWDQYPK